MLGLAVHRIWTLAANDVRLVMKRPTALVGTLLVPLTLMWFLGVMTQTAGTIPRVALVVEDSDGTWLSRSFIEELRRERFDLIAAGEPERPFRPTFVLAIPDGWTAGALGGERLPLRLQRPAGAGGEVTLAAQIYLQRAVSRTSARLFELEAAGGRGAAAVDLRQPPAPAKVSLRIGSAGRGHAVRRGFSQSVPGVLTMIVLMMTLIYGSVLLTTEKQGGMFRRQLSAPVSRRQIFLGKLGGRLFIALLQTGLLLLVGRFFFGISWGPSIAGLLLLTGSYVIAIAALATLLGFVLSTPDQATATGWVLGMMLTALGGCWWPAELMPSWLRDASKFVPTAWAMEGFNDLVSFGVGPQGVMTPCLVLLGFAFLFLVSGARLARAI